MAAHQAGNKLSTLLPADVKHWLPMLEDITISPSFTTRMSVMTAHLEAEHEWTYISLDATLKICLKLKGQTSYRASASARNDAPFGDQLAWRRLLTVRGRSGAVLLLQPLQTEKSEHVLEALQETFTERQLSCVEYIATDSPSAKFYSLAKYTCPNLKGMMLDPIHLAIVYEYGHWNKRTPGSKTLRGILKKTCAVDDSVRLRLQMTLYDGDMSRPLDEAEAKYRDMILSMDMPAEETNAVLGGMDCETPLRSRLEFIQGVAAVCSRYSREVARKAAGPNKEIYKILFAACAPDRLEWLLNNVRVRRALPRQQLHSLPSGTSGNEALHAEINSWSRSTNTLHRSTLALKLRYYRYIEVSAHYLATHFPLAHIVSETVLLSKAASNSIWSDDDWMTWCSEQNTSGRQKKADLPLVKARQNEAALVRAWVKKRPAAQGSKVRKVKRTPLRVIRHHTLRSSGVKSKS